jgi:hypothetical protein
MDGKPAGATPDNVLTLTCLACGKLHRVREFPRDSSGRLALFFRFTCLRCGHTVVAFLQDIVKRSRLAAHRSERPHAREVFSIDRASHESR